MRDANFLTDFHHLATIGATENSGVERLATTKDDKLACGWITAFAVKRNWEVRIDGIGNMFALVEFVSGIPCILLGSHLDSQPLGGRFDGAYGVLAGLHAAKRVASDETSPIFNIAMINWFNEEGGRFAPSIVRSSDFAGLMDEETMLKVKELAGTTILCALESIGNLGNDEHPKVAGYAEIHIDQGRILEREGIHLGAMDYSWHTQKLDIEVLGEQSHTGATTMADHHDVVAAASKMVSLVHDVSEKFRPEALVSSDGQLTLKLNFPVMVARRVHLVADLRSASPQIVRAARTALLSDIAQIANDHDICINVSGFDGREIQYYPPDGLELTEKIAANLGPSVRRIRTRARHDLVVMNRIVPTVMMFVPSMDGVSHGEREFTTDVDSVNGVRTLASVAGEMVNGALATNRCIEAQFSKVGL